MKRISLYLTLILWGLFSCKSRDAGSDILSVPEFQAGLRTRLAEFYPEAVSFPEVSIREAERGLTISTPFADYNFYLGEEDHLTELNRGEKWQINRSIPSDYLQSANRTKIYDALRSSFVGDEWLHPAHRNLRGLEPKLFEPQILALEAFQESYDGDIAGLISLPTGVGKTVTAAYAIKHVLSRKKDAHIVFIAHQVELLINAESTIKSINPELEGHTKIYLGAGRDTSAFREAKVVFAGIQSMARDISELNLQDLDLVIVDEAHRIESDSYQSIVNLGPKYILGLSATPFRTDNRDPLDSLARNLLYGMGPKEAITKGYLVRPDYELFNFGHSLNDNELSSAAKGRQTRALMRTSNGVATAIPTIRTFHNGEQTVAFYPSTDEAQFWNGEFIKANLRSALLLGGGQTNGDRENRRKILQSFAENREDGPRILATVNLMLEGVDVPSIRAILLQRRFTSMVALMQAIGRGLRLSPGKRSCRIGDFLGNHETAADAMALLQLLETEFGIPIELVTGGEEDIFDPDSGELEFSGQSDFKGEVSDDALIRIVKAPTGSIKISREVVDILAGVVSRVRDQRTVSKYKKIADDINAAADAKIYDAFKSISALARFIETEKYILQARLKDPIFMALLTQEARQFINRKERVANDINNLARSDTMDPKVAFQTVTTLAKYVNENPNTLHTWLKAEEFRNLLDPEALTLLQLSSKTGAEIIIERINEMAESGQLQNIQSVKQLAPILGYSPAHVANVIKTSVDSDKFSPDAMKVIRTFRTVEPNSSLESIADFLNACTQNELNEFQSREAIVAYFGRSMAAWMIDNKFLNLLEPMPRRHIMGLTSSGKRLILATEIENIADENPNLLSGQKADLINILVSRSKNSRQAIAKYLNPNPSNSDPRFWLLLRPQTAGLLNLNPRPFLESIINSHAENSTAPSSLVSLSKELKIPVARLLDWLRDTQLIEGLSMDGCALQQLYIEQLYLEQL